MANELQEYMNKSKRKAIIAGNWKMNKTRPEAKELLEAIKPLVANAEGNVEVIACVPFTNLETAINATEGSRIAAIFPSCSKSRLSNLSLISINLWLTEYPRSRYSFKT